MVIKLKRVELNQKYYGKISRTEMDGYIYSDQTHKQNNNGDPYIGSILRSRVSNKLKRLHIPKMVKSQNIYKRQWWLDCFQPLRDNYTVTEVSGSNG